MIGLPPGRGVASVPRSGITPAYDGRITLLVRRFRKILKGTLGSGRDRRRSGTVSGGLLLDVKGRPPETEPTDARQEALGALLAWLVETVIAGRQPDRVRGYELLRAWHDAGESES